MDVKEIGMALPAVGTLIGEIAVVFYARSFKV
jgi:hypothetical protein